MNSTHRALKHLLATGPSMGIDLKASADAGDKLGFLQATVEFALRRKDLGDSFRQYLRV